MLIRPRRRLPKVFACEFPCGASQANGNNLHDNVWIHLLNDVFQLIWTNWRSLFISEKRRRERILIKIVFIHQHQREAASKVLTVAGRSFYDPRDFPWPASRMLIATGFIVQRRCFMFASHVAASVVTAPSKGATRQACLNLHGFGYWVAVGVI